MWLLLSSKGSRWLHCSHRCSLHRRRNGLTRHTVFHQGIYASYLLCSKERRYHCRKIQLTRGRCSGRGNLSKPSVSANERSCSVLPPACRIKPLPRSSSSPLAPSKRTSTTS